MLLVLDNANWCRSRHMSTTTRWKMSSALGRVPSMPSSLGLTRHALVGLTRPSIFSVAAALWLCLRREHYLSSSRKNINFPDIMFELEKEKKLFASSFLLQSFVHCDLIASNPRVSKTFETGIWCKLTFMDPVRWMVKDCAARCRHHRRRIASRRTS